MSAAKTLWHDPVKKFKPRNRQAALIFTKAKPFHLPPEEIKLPRFEPTFEQLLESERKERRRRIEEMDQETRIRKAEQEKRTELKQKLEFQKKLARFKSRQSKKMKRMAEKVSAKINY